ncbi:uncharacterized protein GGS22DRAFT_174466 [Annulohypoxylon maeteangense]|uniref:uncharacterized protein n=1 Tax=Annulohypoxylon maeteangense TaxID=1927788 RepID=UPI002008CC74|nr:uncharacterized protein GGS22DRAFT_174466 [Annulohypoxylon maeteangense]KAI0880665.1 hypothetical protein GGS22DRAFT_174466 [Annulohypoxylon maeteangense]
MASQEAEQQQLADVICVAEDGTLELLDVHEVEKYLDEQPEPGVAVDAIFTEIVRCRDSLESFQVWVSKIWDLVTEKNFWKRPHTTFEAWKAANGACKEIAGQGRSIRDRRREAIQGLMRLGASGPRFEQLQNLRSRSFIEAVERQMAMHGISYPLVTALVNIKAYHRIQPAAGRGRRGVQRTQSAQPCDVTDLDVVTYRTISEEEMAAARVEIGLDGFFVRKGTGSPLIEDGKFDEAIKTFQEARRAAEQTSSLAKSKPPQGEGEGRDDDDDDEQLAAKKEKPEIVLHRHFVFVTKCACTAEVPDKLKNALDGLGYDCGYKDVEPLMSQVLQVDGHLCIRHCQIVLVNGLGVRELRAKRDLGTLHQEVSGAIYRLRTKTEKEPSQKEAFTQMKAGLGFSWDETNKIPLPKLKGRKRKATGSSGSSRKKR